MPLNFLNTGYFADKVGIGTESPGAKLEIKDGNLWLNGATGAYNPEIFFIDDAGPTGIAGAKIRYENNNGNLYFDHKWDNATSGFFFRNRVDGTPLDTMSLVNGNVGIGITTPQAPLSFANVAGNKIDFYFNTTTNDRYGIQVQASELRIHSGAAGASTGGITFGKDNGTTFTEAMRIRNDGKVGIGTDTPGTILDVSFGVSASNTAQINLNGASGAAAELVMRAGGDDNGTIYNRRAAIRYYSNQISTTTAQWVNGVSMTQTTGDDKFYFNNSGNSTVLCLQQNGNVGIGTVSPQTKLQVVYIDTHTSGDLSLSNSAFDIYNNSTTDVAGKGSTLTFSDNYSSTNKTTRAAIKGGTEDAGNTANGFLAFYTDSGGANSMQERMRINEVGAIKFNNYDSTNNTGTPTYLLGTDGSGNIVKTLPQGSGTAGPYLPLAGGTMTGNTDHNDNVYSKYGTADQLRIWNNGSNSYIFNYTSGNINIGNDAIDKDVIFYADRGDGLEDVFFRLDGSETNGTTVLGVTLFPDKSQARFGNQGDLRIYHDGSNSYIQDTGTGTLNLQGSTQVLIGGTNGEVGVQYVENAGVGLRHNNVAKLTTESFGIIVLGDIQIDSALLSNQENTDVDTGTETVASVAIATYTAAFFDFVIKKTTNVRSGTVYACHDGTNVEFTETSTQDLGDTSDVTLSVDISGGNMRLQATTTSDDWSIKSLIRAI